MGKLLAVIESKRMHQILKWLQQSCRGVADLAGCLSGEFLNQDEARFALHQGDQRTLVSSADDGVARPVTQAASFIGDGGALIDGDPASQLTAAIVGAVSYSGPPK